MRPKAARDALPAIPRADDDRSALDQARTCAKCRQPTRIESTPDGVQAFCGPCGLSFPVANASPFWGVPLTLGRGLQKRQLVAPDFSLAFEDEEDMGGG